LCGSRIEVDDPLSYSVACSARGRESYGKRREGERAVLEKSEEREKTQLGERETRVE